jgi:hypothetical protein
MNVSKAGILGVVMLTIIVATFIDCGGNSRENSREEYKVELDSLKKAVLEESDDALTQAEEIGPPAIPALTELLKNENPEIRELALNCVVLTNDDSVPSILVGCLGDGDSQVRTTALQSLRSRCSESILQGLIDNLTNPDTTVRAGVARYIGIIDNTKGVKPLRDRLAEETDPQVNESLKLALARLGNGEYEEEFASRITAPTSDGRYKALLDLEYINDKRLASSFIPALKDTTDAYDIAHPEAVVREFARVCDAAVNLIAKWYNNPFPFEIDEFRRYTDTEIAQAEQFVQSLKK